MRQGTLHGRALSTREPQCKEKALIIQQNHDCVVCKLRSPPFDETHIRRFGYVGKAALSTGTEKRLKTFFTNQATNVPPQLDPAPAVHPKQCLAVLIGRFIKVSTLTSHAKSLWSATSLSFPSSSS